MAFERPITIKEAVANVHSKKYLLPAIQREFVWETDQITMLFDSLMRGYPVGSFLFWSVEPENVRNYQFYEFIRDYHARNNSHNPKASVDNGAGITAILDGQQRLTALYIGLRGSYADKLPRQRWDNPHAFPKRELYLNLLAPSSEADVEFDFRFLTKHDAAKRAEAEFWFKVGDISKFQEQHELNDFLFEHELNTVPKDQARFASRTLFRLHKLIHDDAIINYFMEQDESLDKVLNIFIRVNSGGTKLSYSDLLLSIASAQWKQRDAREEITNFVDELNRTGEGFAFNKDFILKSCLVLCDFTGIAFKVDNFNADNMLKIEERWPEIRASLSAAVILVESFGYTGETLTSNNALIPIAYYLHRLGAPPTFAQASSFAEDRKRILKWLVMSLLKRAFSGVPDNVLRPVRRTLAEHYKDGFPLMQVIDSLKGTTKTLTFANEDVDNLFLYEYSKSYTFSTLALLYPTLDFRNKFHVDHIFPKHLFTASSLRKRGWSEADIQFGLDNYNRLANLQLLEGIPNQEKSGKDFATWLSETYPNEVERRDFMRKHYIPDVDLSLGNFRAFVRERTELLRNAFSMLLTQPDGIVSRSDGL